MKKHRPKTAARRKPPASRRRARRIEAEHPVLNAEALALVAAQGIRAITDPMTELTEAERLDTGKTVRAMYELQLNTTLPDHLRLPGDEAALSAVSEAAEQGNQPSSLT